MTALIRVLAILMAFALVSTVHADPPAWKQQLTRQTNIYKARLMDGSGYRLVDVAEGGSLLAQRAHENKTIRLEAGVQYRILGVCDNDCNDLDLALMKGGMELDKDITTDDHPVLEVTPTSTSEYQVKVTMYHCSTPTCGYQLSIWRK